MGMSRICANSRKSGFITAILVGKTLSELRRMPEMDGIYGERGSDPYAFTSLAVSSPGPGSNAVDR